MRAPHCGVVCAHRQEPHDAVDVEAPILPTSRRGHRCALHCTALHCTALHGSRRRPPIDALRRRVWAAGGAETAVPPRLFCCFVVLLGLQSILTASASSCPSGPVPPVLPPAKHCGAELSGGPRTCASRHTRCGQPAARPKAAARHRRFPQSGRFRPPPTCTRSTHTGPLPSAIAEWRVHGRASAGGAAHCRVRGARRRARRQPHAARSRAAGRAGAGKLVGWPCQRAASEASVAYVAY